MTPEPRTDPASEPIVLGFDPGATTGWCALTVSRGRGRYLYGGAERDLGPLRAILVGHEWRVAIVAVERARTVYAKEGFGPRMAGHLADANFLAGRIFARWECIAPCARVVAYEAGEWRKALACKNNPSDAEVKAALMGRIDGAPARLSVHVRDAIGVALFAALTARLERGAA